VKKTFLAVLASLLSGWTAISHAALVDVAVVNRATGQRIPVWSHQGRLYVAGAPGEKYSVFVGNRTGERVLGVVSVDGINVITGETATPAQSGYVLDPWGRVDINGWRKNMSEVAAFVFTALADSYAARTDRPDNVGVIGVAVFREYQAPRPRKDASRSELRESAGGAGARDFTSAPADALSTMPKPEEKLGTGHGEREASETRWTQFRRASQYPSEFISIYYDSRANLIARGVIPGAPRAAEPNPFPGFRFAPDPKRG
jgi:hypothetical protein